MFANDRIFTYNYFMKEVKKKEKQESEWDKRKIILFLIAAIALIGIGFELKTIIFGDTSAPLVKQVSNTGVKGASTVSAPDIKKGIQDQISNLKSEAQNINVVDIATSSPQVQKVINDLKAIQNYPKNQLKDTCEKICSGL